ncbi:nucleotidyltransferase family protein [Pontivivens ytuae]|uniref:Nucleotidyltransferase family protein n=1 Tax=Pontivivens ytuae TaxID=2789856 RepID=A0A7S9LP78_9RHOB|nr:nucleotidyltransferase family protein [Pontivivens ytuae]QPH52756.1 nucleotidyltransferase family protein [Pontivivens ytuae]
MSLPRAAMVFAAGFGTRMGALTADRPKPLLEIGGCTLLDRALDQIAAAGVAEAVVNTHYHAGLVEAALSGRRAPAIRISHEPEILETGGGLLAARPLLPPAPVMTVNPDVAWGDPAAAVAALAQGWDPARHDACLLVVRRVETRCHPGAGDFDLTEGGPVRRGDRPSAEYVYAGMQVIDPAVLDGLAPGKFSLNVVWNRLLAAGRLGLAVAPGPWVDVGTPEGLAAADALVRG